MTIKVIAERYLNSRRFSAWKMSRAVVKSFGTLTNVSSTPLYLVRATFGDTPLDCAAFAVSEEYRTLGRYPTVCTDVGEIAYSLNKKIFLFREKYRDVIEEGRGVGYIYLYEDFDEICSLICWKDDLDRLVTVSSQFADAKVRPKWR